MTSRNSALHEPLLGQRDLATGQDESDAAVTSSSESDSESYSAPQKLLPEPLLKDDRRLTMLVPTLADGSTGLKIELVRDKLTLSAAMPGNIHGLRAGDLLTGIDGQPCATVEEMSAALVSPSRPRGITTAISILRDPEHIHLYHQMVLHEGWLEYCAAIDETSGRRVWAKGFFVMTLAGGLQCLSDEPGWGLIAIQGLVLDALPLSHIVRAERADEERWSVDVVDASTNFMRLRAPTEEEQQRWLSTINLYCQRGRTQVAPNTPHGVAKVGPSYSEAHSASSGCKAHSAASKPESPLAVMKVAAVPSRRRMPWLQRRRLATNVYQGFLEGR